MVLVLSNQVPLKDKKKSQCGDSHEGLLQPPRGSKGRRGEAEGAIENLTIRPGHPMVRFLIWANLQRRAKQLGLNLGPKMASGKTRRRARRRRRRHAAR